MFSPNRLSLAFILPFIVWLGLSSGHAQTGLDTQECKGIKWSTGYQPCKWIEEKKQEFRKKFQYWTNFGEDGTQLDEGNRIDVTQNNVKIKKYSVCGYGGAVCTVYYCRKGDTPTMENCDTENCDKDGKNCTKSFANLDKGYFCLKNKDDMRCRPKTDKKPAEKKPFCIGEIDGKKRCECVIDRAGREPARQREVFYINKNENLPACTKEALDGWNAKHSKGRAITIFDNPLDQARFPGPEEERLAAYDLMRRHVQVQRLTPPLAVQSHHSDPPSSSSEGATSIGRQRAGEPVRKEAQPVPVKRRPRPTADSAQTSTDRQVSSPGQSIDIGGIISTFFSRPAPQSQGVVPNLPRTGGMNRSGNQPTGAYWSGHRSSQDLAGYQTGSGQPRRTAPTVSYNAPTQVQELRRQYRDVKKKLDERRKKDTRVAACKTNVRQSNKGYQARSDRYNRSVQQYNSDLEQAGCDEKNHPTLPTAKYRSCQSRFTSRGNRLNAEKRRSDQELEKVRNQLKSCET